MYLQFFVIFLVGVALSSGMELAKLNSTSSGNILKRTSTFYGSEYWPKGYDRKSVIGVRSDTHYGYDPPDGAETWPDKFPECGGDRQSPINLPPREFDARLSRTPLSFNRYDITPYTLEFENSGHSMHVTGEWDENEEPSLTGGPLVDGEYTFSQLHFHWGRDNSRGSEHTIDHKRYPCEMHVVHARRGDVSVNPYEEVPDDIAVVGYMCEISQHDNRAFTPLLEACSRIRQPGTKVKLTPFPIGNLLREFQEDYVTYEGSLTTPPCSENVKWIVSAKPLRLSNRQMQQLRTCIRDDNGNTMANFRPVQRRNNRSLYYLTL